MSVCRVFESGVATGHVSNWKKKKKKADLHSTDEIGNGGDASKLLEHSEQQRIDRRNPLAFSHTIRKTRLMKEAVSFLLSG